MAFNLDKLYGSATEALKYACSSFSGEKDGEEVFKAATKSPEEWLKNRCFTPIIPALEVWVAVREELSKEKGGTVYSAMKRIIKSAERTLQTRLHGAWIGEDGMQYVCDGYRAVRRNKPVEGLPEAVGMDVREAFWDGGDATLNVKMLDLPTIGELRMCIAEQKGMSRKFYDFGDGLPRVNAEYLRDAIEALPNSVAMFNADSPNNAILFRSDDGDALLLPVRKG